MRVLIVEDDPLIAMLLVDSLADAGHEVVGPAATMAEALALCGASTPDLALLDIDLRDGSSGLDVARALLDRWGVRSIFASGQVVEARQARGAALGYVRKPYALRTVVRGIEVARQVMDGAEPRAVPAGFELFSARP